MVTKGNSTVSCSPCPQTAAAPWPSYYRARYYDPAVGRFLIEDPTKFNGGVNFYRYASNNAVKLVDPFGLDPTAPPLPWWWILENPIVVPIVTVGPGGAAIIIGIGELSRTFDRHRRRASHTPDQDPPTVRQKQAQL